MSDDAPKLTSTEKKILLRNIKMVARFGFLLSIIGVLAYLMTSKGDFFPGSDTYAPPAKNALELPLLAEEKTPATITSVMKPHELAPSKKSVMVVTEVDWTTRKIDRPIEGAYIVIFLSKRVLTIVKNGKYIRVFRDVNLPKIVNKFKTKKGDGFTPLGDYKVIKTTIVNGKLALLLDYPNAKDGLAALKEKRITKKNYDSILRAARANYQAPTNTPLGGPIYIKGDGVKGKFTRGNISVLREQMQELWHAASKGMPVRIMK